MRTMLVLCAVVPLAACAGSQPPASSVTTTVTATQAAAPLPAPSVVTPSARPIALKVPPQASRNDSTGAAATATYYFQAVDRAFATGDASALRAVSTATNRTTADFAERAAAMHSEGSTPLGATQQTDVISAAKLPAGPGASSVMAVRVLYSSPQVQVQGKTGQIAQVAAVPPRTVTVKVVRVTDRWLVESVTDPAATPVRK